VSWLRAPEDHTGGHRARAKAAGWIRGRPVTLCDLDCPPLDDPDPVWMAERGLAIVVLSALIWSPGAGRAWPRRRIAVVRAVVSERGGGRAVG
jgi:hypothetical protein